MTTQITAAKETKALMDPVEPPHVKVLTKNINITFCLGELQKEIR